MDGPESEWQRKGATLSDRTARKEFGLTQDEIVRAMGMESSPPKVDYATGMDPTSVAVADFNLDGKPDLAEAMSVLLGSCVP